MNDRVRDTSLLAPRASDLLRLYRPGAHVFASPRCSLIAQGVHAVLRDTAEAGLAPAARRLLAEVQREGLARPVLVGAVPFRGDARAELVVPEGLVFGHGVEPGSPCGRAEVSGRCAAQVQPLPSPEAYRCTVQQAVDCIDGDCFDKVVLSRSLRVATPIDRAALLRRLFMRNPAGYTFAVEMAASDGRIGRTLMGASPELLLSRRGTQVCSHPLAGSIARSDDAREDARRAQGLLQSQKDLREHAFVVDAVAQALRPHCRRLNVPAAPALVKTATMWHLGTRIEGELQALDAGSLDLALALHPTPAVCGHPAQPARRFIDAHEGFDRGFFAGLVGWCDASGDGEWAVTIRCAEVDERSATLYAGAGVVKGSDPQAELAETSAKLRTMLQAMAVELTEPWRAEVSA